MGLGGGMLSLYISWSFNHYKRFQKYMLLISTYNFDEDHMGPMNNALVGES